MKFPFTINTLNEEERYFLSCKSMQNTFDLSKSMQKTREGKPTDYDENVDNELTHIDLEDKQVPEEWNI